MLRLKLIHGDKIFIRTTLQSNNDVNNNDDVYDDDSNVLW